MRRETSAEAWAHTLSEFEAGAWDLMIMIFIVLIDCGIGLINMINGIAFHLRIWFQRTSSSVTMLVCSYVEVMWQLRDNIASRRISIDVSKSVHHHA